MVRRYTRTWKRRKPTRYKRRWLARRMRKPRPRYMPGFPKTKLVKMRYVDIVDLNPGVGTLAYHLFRANSIQDPDYSGAGHQPLGHDQWEAFYNHYVVVGSKITAQFQHDGANTNTGQAIGIYLSDDTVFPTSGTELMEQGRGRYKVMSAVNYAPVGSGPFHVPTIRNSFSAKKFFNVANISDNFDRLGATVGVGNPTESCFYTVWAGPLDVTDDLPPTKVLVTIEYSVLYSEPKALTQS